MPRARGDKHALRHRVPEGVGDLDDADEEIVAMTSTAMEPDSAELSKLKADIAPQMDALVEKIEAFRRASNAMACPCRARPLRTTRRLSLASPSSEFDQLAIPRR